LRSVVPDLEYLTELALLAGKQQKHFLKATQAKATQSTISISLDPQTYQTFVTLHKTQTVPAEKLHKNLRHGSNIQ
jgi:hypothetical protein